MTRPREPYSLVVGSGPARQTIDIRPPQGSAALPPLTSPDGSEGLMAGVACRNYARSGRWDDAFLWIVGEPVPRQYVARAMQLRAAEAAQGIAEQASTPRLAQPGSRRR